MDCEPSTGFPFLSALGPVCLEKCPPLDKAPLEDMQGHTAILSFMCSYDGDFLGFLCRSEILICFMTYPSLPFMLKE